MNNTLQSIAIIRRDINTDSRRLDKIECLQRNRRILLSSLITAEGFGDSTEYDRIISKVYRIDHKISVLMRK